MRANLVSTTIAISLVLTSGACGATSPAPEAAPVSQVARCELERVFQSGAETRAPNDVVPGQPLPRYGAAAVGYAGGFYVIGGSGPDGFLGTVERFDATNESWTTVASGLVERRFLTAAVHGHHLYVLGGYTEDSERSSVVERVDLQTGIVMTVAPLPRPRYAAAAAVLAGQLYFVGGVVETERLAVAERYDVAANAWSTAPSLSTGRNLHMVEMGGSLLALGGYAGPGRPAVTVVEQLDVRNDEWVTITHMPEPSTAFSAASLGNLVVTFGDYVNLGRVRVLDVSTRQWMAVNVAFTPRRHSAAATVADRIFVFGGNTAREGSWSNRLEAYEVSCDERR